MDNHVHLLATPPEAGATARMMQKLDDQYLGQFNARHRHTGTLWEGRYKACLVDSADNLLRCLPYIDLNPTRARMTDDPVAFAWSSCAALCGKREDPLLTLHPSQRELGATDAERSDAYRALLTEALNHVDLAFHPPLPATTARLRPRRLPGDGGGEDPAVCRSTPCASAGPLLTARE